MKEQMKKEEEEKFSIYVESKNYPTPLIQIDLSFGRLMVDVIIPYEEGELFFVDGVSLKKEDIKRFKILKQYDLFGLAFRDFNVVLERGDPQQSKIFGEQYHIRLEAILRRYGDDVTAQMISVFNTEVKPKLKDTLKENRKDIIDIAKTIFNGGIKLLA